MGVFADPFSVDSRWNDVPRSRPRSRGRVSGCEEGEDYGYDEDSYRDRERGSRPPKVHFEDDSYRGAPTPRPSPHPMRDASNPSLDDHFGSLRPQSMNHGRPPLRPDRGVRPSRSGGKGLGTDREEGSWDDADIHHSLFTSPFRSHAPGGSSGLSMGDQLDEKLRQAELRRRNAPMEGDADDFRMSGGNLGPRDRMGAGERPPGPGPSILKRGNRDGTAVPGQEGERPGLLSEDLGVHSDTRESL